MIKEAINRILELDEPHFNTINGDTYCDRQLHRINNELRADSIGMTSLSSLVDYIKHNQELKDVPYIVHIISPTEVRLISSLDYDRKREVLAVVNAELLEFQFNREIERERFTIGVQSKFVDEVVIDGEPDDKALILKFAGTVKSGTVAEYSDDGVTQKATVKKGVSSMTEAIVPSPCKLTPYRTFIEVDQPTSEFIFRLNEDRSGEITCALYEADGGAWRLTATESIKEYLKEELKNIAKPIMIIS